jgi:hypothetical protein
MCSRCLSTAMNIRSRYSEIHRVGPPKPGTSTWPRTLSQSGVAPATYLQPAHHVGGCPDHGGLTWHFDVDARDGTSAANCAGRITTDMQPKYRPWSLNYS